MKPDKFFTPLVLGVFLTWLGFGFITVIFRLCGDIEKFAQMGDAFNILNALFSGLAFAFIAIQLWFQAQQIKDEKENRRQDELILAQKIRDEKESRRRSDQISALSTRIQTTFDKIQVERGLLIKIAPTFQNVSFLHDDECPNIKNSIEVKENLVVSLKGLISLMNKTPVWSPSIQIQEDYKSLWEHEMTLPMLKQIQKWVGKLEEYENKLDQLLDREHQD